VTRGVSAATVTKQLQHVPVLEGVSCILNDGHNICSVLGHVNQIPTTAVRELHSVHDSLFTNQVADMRHCRSAGSTKVEHLPDKEGGG
jgi:hypothetical protein